MLWIKMLGGTLGGLLLGALVLILARRLIARYQMLDALSDAQDVRPTERDACHSKRDCYPERSEGSLLAPCQERAFVRVPAQDDRSCAQDIKLSGLPVLCSVLVPGAMALWGGYVGWRAVGWPQALSALVASALLLALALVDWRVRRLPNALTLALLGWAMIQAFALRQLSGGAALAGLALGGGLFALLALIGRGALGLGDVKLAGALGALLGYPLIVQGLSWGILAGGLGALVLFATRRIARGQMLAYGPYLALGGWFALIRLLQLG